MDPGTPMHNPTAAPDLPMTVARAVHRTGTPVMLDDAAADATVFRDDPYIRERRVRSLLCAPLVHQGRPLGVLYLENSLTAGVFTGHHIRVIHLLATQAARGPIAVSALAPASSPIEGEESPAGLEMSLAGEASVFGRSAAEVASQTSLPSRRPAGDVASSARAPRRGSLISLKP